MEYAIALRLRDTLKGKGEPFGSLARTTAVLEGFPKLKAVVGTFRASPGMKHYLSVRGDAGKVKW